MAISTIVLAWLDHLAKHALLPAGPMLEFGPQDVSAPRHTVEAFLGRRLEPAAAAAALDRIYGPAPPNGRQTEIYRALGLTDYASVDFGDTRADFNHDLNLPLDIGRRFQVVTNFGTAEHIFNISVALESQYRHLAVGGVALLILPAFGHINHGFYNIHPTLYTDLAAANAMDIVDLQYIDDAVGRSHRLEAAGSCELDVDALPIKPLTGQYGNFHVIVAMTYLRNLAGLMRNTAADGVPHPVVDLCMVALRRTASSPPELRATQQAIYVREAADPGAAHPGANAGQLRPPSRPPA